MIEVQPGYKFRSTLTFYFPWLLFFFSLSFFIIMILFSLPNSIYLYQLLSNNIVIYTSFNLYITALDSFEQKLKCWLVILIHPHSKFVISAKSDCIK
jgi:hypothetical protein